MTDRELLEQALKLVAKYHARETILVDWEKSVIEAIKARLAEDDEEPYAWVAIPDHHGDDALYYDKQEAIDDGHSFVGPLYRHPRPKSRLTDEEINDCFDIAQRSFHKHQSGIKGQQLNIQDWPNWHFARAIEQKIWGRAE